MTARAELSALLQRDQELREIAGLVGLSALADVDRLAIEMADLVRDVVLRQSAYDPNDYSSPPPKTYALVRRCARLFKQASAALAHGAALSALPLARAGPALIALRDAPAAELEARGRDVDALIDRIHAQAAA